GGQREFRRREVASEAGVSLHSARKLWRAIGFPELSDDEVFFTEADKKALGTMVGMVREGTLTEETAISLMRSVGQMTDRMVVWQIEALVEDMIANQNLSDRQARRQLFS
ncbi:adenylate/guanylate cyclase domain-containing protein, partial [Escherichia coli]|nr:adenylate/guanylate cyclase domain-containing protein [Escherichia coli]